MSIGYDMVTPHDFINYFCGCSAFNYNPDTGRVKAWVISDLYDPDEYGYANECTVRLTEPTTREDRYNLLLGKSRDVDCSVLFDSPRWIIHRFSLGYVPMEDGKLVYVAAETTERRMRKGTNLGLAEFSGLLFREDKSDQGDDDRLVGLVTHAHISDATAEIASGIATVLEYGNNPAMRRNIPANEARQRSNQAIKDLLSGKLGTDIVVPSFDTAVIRTGDKRHQAAMLLYNGRYLGQIKLSRGTVTLEARTMGYNDIHAGRLARDGLEALVVPMVVDRVVNL